MIRFITKTFEALNPHELYEILKLRAEVFVVEQNCAYLDMDGKDQQCLHVLGYDGEQLAAYARLVPSRIFYDSPAIGRVVTGTAFRKNGYGRALMNYSMSECQHHFHSKIITISAQQYLEPFYNSLGFEPRSAMYLEDDIPHLKMIYTAI